jgi:hypothetical protein
MNENNWGAVGEVFISVFLPLAILQYFIIIKPAKKLIMDKLNKDKKKGEQ